MQMISKCLFLVLMAVLPLAQRPLVGAKLMLYFDVNKTLIASDKSGNKSVEDVLNQLLACKYEDKWDSSVKIPISYDAYVREVLLPGPEQDVELKKKRKGYLDHFLDYLKETNHPRYSEVLTTYTVALERLTQSQSCVFSSFYRLLEKLDHENRSYTLILRSFGSEVFDVAEEIHRVSGKVFEHPGMFMGDKLLVDDQIVGDNPLNIYALLKRSGHRAIRDDWHYWMKGNMNSQYGKMFVLDPADADTLSLFFDDNISLDDREQNIISPIDVASGQPVSIKELAQRRQVVAVDTLEAILDENYFIHLVQDALRSHEL